MGSLLLNQSTWFFSNLMITAMFLLTSSGVCLRFLTLLPGVDPAGKAQTGYFADSVTKPAHYSTQI